MRWFTPVAEVDLCGHATLAAAHALREWDLAGGELQFHTRAGILSARLQDEGVALDFPATPPDEIDAPEGLAQALGCARREVLWCGRSRFDLVLRLPSAHSISALAPDFAALKTFEARGVCVSAPGLDRGCDFVSRFFAPRVGIDEDPATGSAHCALAPLWRGVLEKQRMFARQLSSRGGEMHVEARGERVLLQGQAHTVLRGEILAV